MNPLEEETQKLLTSVRHLFLIMTVLTCKTEENNVVMPGADSYCCYETISDYYDDNVDDDCRCLESAS